MRLLNLFVLPALLLIGCNGGPDSKSEDLDNDGYPADGGDCNDNDDAIHPGAEDVPGDGVDEDCSGSDEVETDADGDGYCGTPSLGEDCPAEADCDDNNPDVYPGATEKWYDGIDQNCDGNDADYDGDGVIGGDSGTDCNDEDPGIYPGATEDCGTAADDNCDGLTDEEGAKGCSDWYPDADGDLFGDDTGAACTCTVPTDSASTGGDCDDQDAAINPDAAEVCDGIDNNCDSLSDDEDPTIVGQGTWYTDGDGDLHGVGTGILACFQPAGTAAVGDDCNDADATVYPGAAESDLDTVDSDCDGSIVDDDPDGDGDGYNRSVDCDDGNAAIHPGAVEMCDGVDNNCDTLTDDSSAIDATSWYVDADTDGYGDPASTPTAACSAPSGLVADSTDCDDGDLAIHPGALEILGNAVDEDCDGVAQQVPDDDGDGYDAVYAGGTDCDDSDPAINPGATEVCNTIDDNCDGTADEGVTSPFYADTDGDAYGDSTSVLYACNAPSGFVVDDTDCDDSNNAISPAATEVCDAANVDENCDSLADDADPNVDTSTTQEFGHDQDGDGFGDINNTVSTCDLPTGYIADTTDCNDGDAGISPAAQEVCDAADTDENCDGRADNADPGVASAGQITGYVDNDGDFYGDPASTIQVCDLTAGYVANSSDCNDGDPAISPAATEICDAADVDEDCNTIADDADPNVDSQSYNAWYSDNDGDSYGDMTSAQYACDAPSGLIADGTDCNDGDPAISPGATEICDAANVDEDCNGAADDNDVGVDPSGFLTWYSDSDGDHYGLAKVSLDACDQPTGYASASGDCDDAVAAVNPGASEVCDAANMDEDCDGLADDKDPDTASKRPSWFADTDKDGYGDRSASPTVSCEQPAQTVSNATDCNDGNAAINPAASEVCDAANTDENCNGTADDDDSTVSIASYQSYYGDFDSDGYGDPDVLLEQCDLPASYVADNTDCDDGDGAISPAAQEICDGGNVDEDCNTIADDNDPGVDPGTYSTWYADADLDNYGDPNTYTYACDKPTGYIANSTDCNDSSSSVHPGATEVCDAANLDEDCDKLADDKDPSVSTATMTSWYKDADNDGYGAGTAQAACDQPSGYVASSTDCDDTLSTTHPGAADVCQDGVDRDCVDSCTWSGTHADTEAKATYTGTSNGGTSFGFFGGNISGGRDVNGDGYSDVAIGDRLWDTASTTQNQGRVFLFSGSKNGITDTVASPTARFTGDQAGDRIGGGVSMVDDVNADLKDELLIGAYLDNVAATDCGSAMLFRGGALSGAVLNSSASVTVVGTALNDYLGWAVSGGGDLTGDGTPDWAVSAYFNNTVASKAGKVAVVSGGLAAGTYNYTSMTAVLSGVSASDRFGASILSDIDVNKDGVNDLVVDSIGKSAAYIFLGPVSGSKSYASADYSISGVALTSNTATLESNCSDCLANAGDVNGDGYDDLLVGADGYDGAAADIGAAFLFSGKITASTSVTSATATIKGVVASDFAGRSVSGAWDVDFDGYDDFLVGAPGYDASSGEGMAALVYGPATGTYDISSSSLVRFVGSINNGSLGTSVAGIGDVDGDSDGDFMLGAPNAVDGGTYKFGKAYLYYGNWE